MFKQLFTFPVNILVALYAIVLILFWVKAEDFALLVTFASMITIFIGAILGFIVSFKEPKNKKGL